MLQVLDSTPIVTAVANDASQVVAELLRLNVTVSGVVSTQALEQGRQLRRLTGSPQTSPVAHKTHSQVSPRQDRYGHGDNHSDATTPSSPSASSTKESERSMRIRRRRSRRRRWAKTASSHSEKVVQPSVKSKSRSRRGASDESSVYESDDNTEQTDEATSPSSPSANDSTIPCVCVPLLPF